MIEHRTLDKVINDLSRMKESESNKIKLNRIEFCKEFIETIALNHNISLKEACPFNYFYIGENFKESLYRKYKENFNTLYIFCARFLKEYILYLERMKINPISPFITSLWDKFKYDDLSLLDERHIKQAEYIRNKMAVDILNFYFGEDGFKAFKEYANIKKEIDETNKKTLETKEKIETFISEKEKNVIRLEEALSEQKTAFNFVGLSQGFESLLKKKKNSQSIVLSLLFFIGISLFIPLFTYMEFYQLKTSNNELFDWKIFFPFFSIELITLYLFRVVLIHYNSIKTQMMQLELRQTLCQFIQSYADYAKEIKEKDRSSLEKFENLIFSSILSDSEKVPSTFDGLEQLANLIKNIKSGQNK